MYHSRTKKVVSYGRRAQRVVAVTDKQRFVMSDSSEGLSDSDLSRCSGQNEVDEADIFAPPTNSAKSHLNVGRHSTIPQSVAVSRRKNATGKKPNGNKTSSRKPLGLYRSNVPNSPALPPKALAKKHTPLASRNVSSISPYIDVNITVLDEIGRRLSDERRVTKVNVRVNDIDGGVANAAKRSRRLALVKSYPIFSSEEDENEDEDEEYTPMPKASKGKQDHKDIVPSSSSRTNSKAFQRSRKSNMLEVEAAAGNLTFKKPSKSRLLKNGARIVVVSDSDSDSSARTNRAHKEEGRQITEVHQPKKRNIRAKPNQIGNLTHDAPVPTQGVLQVQRTKSRGRRLNNVPGSSQLAKAISTPKNRPEHFDSKASLQGDLFSESNTSQCRQITSIQPSRRKAAFLRQRPVWQSPSQRIVISDDDDSFTIDEELKLALQVADLELAKSSQRASKKQMGGARGDGRSDAASEKASKLESSSRNGSRKPSVPSYLRRLLAECGQLSPFDFDTFIETFALDPVVSLSSQTGFSERTSRIESSHSFQKVGEASYSEVFGIGNVVLKVVPLLDEENEVSVTWSASWDSPPVSEAKDVLQEIVVTRAMGDICKGFIKLLKAHVVQGPYPKSLIALWDKYDDMKGSESIRPDQFTAMQTYAIIILPNGGPDLENFSFGSSVVSSGFAWRQACSIFWQVTRSLANAEELVNFEHRDLHWGQILVRNTSKSKYLPAPSSCKMLSLDDISHGVQSTIIDLGLARIDQGNGASFWTPLTEEIFEGEGDYQYDIYRMMRKHNKDEWRSFRPLTNVMWLHYLADKLLNHKHIRASTRSAGKRSRTGLGADTIPQFAEVDIRAFHCLAEVEQLLGDAIESVARSVGAKIKKRMRPTNGKFSDLAAKTQRELKTASDVLRFGKERRWIS